LTNKSAQFRPHCVDLTPGAYNRPDYSRDNSASRHYAEAAERHSRKKSKGRLSRAKSGNPQGAVRLTTVVDEPKFNHIGKVSAALACIASGVFWTTTSNGKSATALEVAAEPQPVVVRASVLKPTFFFDDSVDALAAHFPETFTPIISIAPNIVSPSLSESEMPKELPVAPIDTLTTPDPLPVEPLNTAPLEEMFDPSIAPTEIDAPKLMEEDVMPMVDHPSIMAVREQTIAPEDSVTNTIVVAAGNTLSGILNDHGIKIEQMPKLLTDEVIKDNLSRLKIGQKLEITQLSGGEFHSLTARVAKDKRITIRRSADDFAVAAIDLPVEKERVVTSGTIEQSLYLAAEEANLKQSTIMELSDIFQWELDFARDIRKGDRFALVYDRLYRDGSYIGDGDILAAEFVRGGRTHRAIRFTTDDGETGYYSPEGESLRRTFMRHPVDVVRITSRFNPNRLHPVLHKIQAHRGVDYGSPHGSPIYATADGTVTYSGSKGAYGNTVVLQHGQRFSTLYAHMSKISSKSKKGKRIRQGDVIGYVGKTGRVTGTHLHYEFRVNNEQIDPLKVKLPAAEPLAKKYLAELKVVSAEMTAQMQSVIPTIKTVAATSAAITDISSRTD